VNVAGRLNSGGGAIRRSRGDRLVDPLSDQHALGLECANGSGRCGKQTHRGSLTGAILVEGD
jgi:hypothetical protein